MISREDPWAADLLKIEDQIGICIANNTLKEVYSQITHAAAVFVLGFIYLFINLIAESILVVNEVLSH